MRKSFIFAAIAFVGVSMTGCGDPASSDPRPLYSKAPLERPGVRITAESPTEMARIGTPNLVPVFAPEASD